MENESINREGSLNPMHGKKHDELTRRKISDSQKRRYEKIRQQIASKEAVDGNSVSLSQLSNNNLTAENVYHSVNFLSYTMRNNNKIQEIITEELNKLLQTR